MGVLCIGTLEVMGITVSHQMHQENGKPDVHIFNQPVLTKQGWRIMLRYFLKSNFLESFIREDLSFTWRFIQVSNAVLAEGL